jgi:uncharacterized protein (DUF779 family)
MEVSLTGSARAIVERVKERRGNLVFVFGDGCCEGTSPHLFDDYYVDPEQIRVGELEGIPVFASPHIHRLYGGRRVVIDVDVGALSDSLSVETELGCRFILLDSPA